MKQDYKREKLAVLLAQLKRYREATKLSYGSRFDLDITLRETRRRKEMVYTNRVELFSSFDAYKKEFGI